MNFISEIYTNEIRISIFRLAKDVNRVNWHEKNQLDESKLKAKEREKGALNI